MATIVAFHAHPDDEVLLTGGTIARLAAEGHRFDSVTDTNGEMWPGEQQGRRLAELRASAAILGADKAVHLGYADSGAGPVLFDDPPGGIRFARADVEEAAGKLASLLADEHADLLLSYDPQGGYGQSDHVRVHQVGARAAQLAGVRVAAELVARVAALDVVKKEVVACVRVPREDKPGRRQEVRAFATTTRSLLELRDWLACHQVSLCVMEATSVCW